MNDRMDVSVEECFYGTATVGERGQLVIPAEARNDLGIKPGDKLLVMRHPFYRGLMIAKLDAMRDFVDMLQRNVAVVKEEAETES